MFNLPFFICFRGPDVDSPMDVINSWLALLAYSKFVTSWGLPFCFEIGSSYSVNRYTWTFVRFNLALMTNFCLNFERRNLVSCCSHLWENPHPQLLFWIPKNWISGIHFPSLKSMYLFNFFKYIYNSSQLKME